VRPSRCESNQDRLASIASRPLGCASSAAHFQNRYPIAAVIAQLFISAALPSASRMSFASNV
jgi:hypothetical protein